METEDFRPGDTITLPFLIVAGDDIVNISDGVVSAVLQVSGGSSVELTVGDAIAIHAPAPQPDPDPDHQVAHGIITLSAEVTSALPLGRRTTLTVFFVNSAGSHMHTAPITLRGVA